jgi:hypothetical protein
VKSLSCPSISLIKHLLQYNVVREGIRKGNMHSIALRLTAVVAATAQSSNDATNEKSARMFKKSISK